MFEEIDKEEDGEIYVREVLDYLRACNQDFDRNVEVIFVEHYTTVK